MQGVATVLCIKRFINGESKEMVEMNGFKLKI